MRKVKKMNNEQAINWLTRIKGRYIFGGDEKFDELRREALDLGIKALENNKSRPRGKWIFDGVGNMQCTNCNFALGNKLVKQIHPFVFSFCPDCGADMRDNKKETTFDDYLNKQLKDPEFRKEWEKLCDEDKQKGDVE